MGKIKEENVFKAKTGWKTDLLYQKDKWVQRKCLEENENCYYNDPRNEVKQNSLIANMETQFSGSQLECNPEKRPNSI
jgi:hypothetical protein